MNSELKNDLLERKRESKINLLLNATTPNSHIYRKLLKNSKSNYYNDKFNCYKYYYKQLYKLTNKLLVRTKKIILPDLLDIQLYSTFSDYFSDKIKLTYDNLNTLNKQLPDIQLYYDYAILTPTFTVFSLPTTTEIYNIIITSNCSSPSEPLPLQTLKKLASTIAPIYKRFIDESLITGTIPSDLKHSIISPLTKKAKLDCNTLSNYRPISQLTTLTKLLEKVIYKQLILYPANNILDHQQIAFRKLHSTETIILSLLDDLLKSIYSDFPIQLLLLDLSSAFDTINLYLLIYRLKLI